jgi:phospholipid N-methyltransferase
MTVQRESSKLLWGIISGLILIVVLAFAYFNFNSRIDTSTEQVPSSESVSEIVSSEIIVENTPVSEANTSTALISEDVLKAPISDNPSLAKEEVAKLDDVQAQLKDQEKILEEQHADADQIIKLKEEQIKLLEAQLAESK